jgi:hypothetical protein
MAANIGAAAYTTLLAHCRGRVGPQILAVIMLLRRTLFFPTPPSRHNLPALDARRTVASSWRGLKWSNCPLRGDGTRMTIV